MTEQECEDFVSAVRKMREWQRRWFGGQKDRDTLIASKRAEQDVDRILRRFAPGQAGLDV